MSDQSLVLRGGEVMDPTSGLRGRFDVAFDGDRVTGIGPDLAAGSAIDATGCLVVPGLIDLHSHVFEGIGDATVLRLESGAFTIHDVDGRTRETQQRIVAVGVVRAGVWVPAA